ncbi:MAG TPA: metallophosphoesterase [Myxococcales bacterium]|jgi:hypothetical protein
MVTVTRRTFLSGLSLLLLAELPACDMTEADERNAGGQRPGTATLANGISLSISPGRVRTVDGAVVVRAASPTPEIALSAAAGEARFRLANVQPGSSFNPPPASRQTVGPTTVEFVYQVPTQGLRIRVQPPGAGPARFALISDLHNNLETFGRFTEAVEEWQPDAALCMGDIADHGKPEELDQMLALFDALPVPFYTTVGNHDLMGAAADRFDEVIGPTNVAFDLRGVRIVLADTANALFSPGAYGWLADSLVRDGGPALVFSHIPPLEPWGGRNHAFSNRDDALHFVQVIAQGGATHYFAGHIHSYADYTMRDVPSTIAGGGGGSMEAMLGQGHFFMKLVVDPYSATQPLSMERVGLDE